MITQFRSSETEVGVRAAALGTACRPLIHRNLAGYTRLFDVVGVLRAQLRRYGEEAGARLAAWAPSRHQELGLARRARRRQDRADLELPFQDRAATLLTIELGLGAGQLRFLDGGPCRAAADDWRVF